MQNGLLEGEDLERGQLIKVRVGNGPWQLALVLNKSGRGWDPNDDEGCLRYWSLRLVNNAVKYCVPKNSWRYGFPDDVGNSKFLTVYRYDSNEWTDKWRAHELYNSTQSSWEHNEYAVRFKAVSK